MMKMCKVFRIEDFGNVGEANLLGFVATSGKSYQELEVGESCAGKVTKQLMPFAQAREELRVTRLEDKPCV
jgi:hypothetical protein